MVSALVSTTDDQLLDGGDVPPSGAAFTDALIEPLPASPLHALAPPEHSEPGLVGGFVPHSEAVMPVQQVFSPALPQQIVSPPAPASVIITIPPPGGAGTQVFEAGLGARGSEPAGSHAGSPAFQTTTRPAVISFTVSEGLDSVTLGGQTLHVGDTRTIADGTTGSLTATFVSFDEDSGRGALRYTYTLLDNTSGVPNTHFAFVVNEANGQSTTGNLVINIVDDVPIARADTDRTTATDPSTDGNVIDGTGTTSAVVDVLGADGPRAGGALVGIAAGFVTGNPVGGVNTIVTGVHGTLTIDENGHYTYTRSSSGTDTFTYTIQDSDGSLASSTLTIGVDNAVPGNIVVPPEGIAGAGTQVDEAGLPAGTNSAANSETTTGTITFWLASATRRRKRTTSI